MIETSRHRSFGARVGWIARALSLAPLAFAATLSGSQAFAQDRPFWEQGDPPARQTQSSRPRRDDAYRPPEDYTAPSGGFGTQAGPDGRPWSGQQQPQYGQPYGGTPQGGAPSYGQQPYGGAPGGFDQGGARAAQGPNYDPRYDAPMPQQAPYGGGRANDAYRAPQQYGGGPGYQSDSGGSYGQPYAPPPENGAPVYGGPGGYGQGQQYGSPNERWDEPRGGGSSTYSQNEVVDAGHRFFGSVSQGLARAVENLFKSQGRPNGYILGEDAGGAFVAGLRYGEGVLYTKDVGSHKVYWQGPSLGYDFGGEGSKTMVLVYRLRDPSDIYNRFGGVQGSAYLIGGVSVQLQTYEHVTLAVIRSGLGLRLGANVGYLKYTRTPTWNPF